MIDKIILLLTILILHQCQCQIQIKVKKDQLDKLKTDLFHEKFPINLPAQEHSFNIYIGTIKIILTDIKIILDELNPEDIKINFSKTKTIHITFNDIKLSSEFTLTTIFGFLQEKDHIKIKVKSLNGKITTSLGTFTEDNKSLPTLHIEDINYKLDYDFDINGKILAHMANLVKRNLKKYIDYKIKTAVKTLLKSNKSEIQKIFKKKFTSIRKDILVLQYSLSQDPYIEDDNVVFDLNLGLKLETNSDHLDNPSKTHRKKTDL